MIYVTPGYEGSASFDAFMAAMSCYPQYVIDNFTLILEQSTIKSLNKNYSIRNDLLEFHSIRLPLIISNNDDLSATQSTLITALDLITEEDQLLTLPTQKNQFKLEGKFINGYTEFFRNWFNHKDIVMSFRSEKHSMLLLSDHIPLAKVPLISEKQVLGKVRVFLDSLYHHPEEIIFLGINPHAGERGLIGKEDKIIESSLKKLEKEYPHLKFKGPLAADSILLTKIDFSKTLIVSPFHDQGLGIFKSQNGLFGANISIGLPFIRYSVDHGTAPNKNLRELKIDSFHYVINLMLKDWMDRHGK